MCVMTCVRRSTADTFELHLRDLKKERQERPKTSASDLERHRMPNETKSAIQRTKLRNIRYNIVLACIQLP